jgi:hypothetical protein
MRKDPRDSLALAYDLPPEVSDYLDIIEALALHRDIPSCVGRYESHSTTHQSQSPNAVKGVGRDAAGENSNRYQVTTPKALRVSG